MDLRGFFQSLQKQLVLQSQYGTSNLPHSGEQGRNHEAIIQRLLTDFMPRRFALGTGFVTCSEPGFPQSGQTDILIFDEWNNSPLLHQEPANIFPIEVVYAALEVKKRIRHGDVGESFGKIAQLREMKKHKWFIEFDSAAPLGNPVTVVKERAGGGLAPRTHIVAFSADWDSCDRMKDYLQAKLLKHSGAHLHGLTVLEQDWFFFQPPYTQQIVATQGDALLRFLSALLTQLQSFNDTGVCAMHRYQSA